MAGAGNTAGALDHRVQFWRAGRATGLVDDGLQARETWAPHGLPVWASRRDISDAERWQSGQMNAEITTRFVIRGSAFACEITPRDRLACGGVTYDIAGVKVIGRREWVEITARARADEVAA